MEQTDYPVSHQIFQPVSLPCLLPASHGGTTDCAGLEGQTAIEYFSLKKKRFFYVFSMMDYSNAYCHKPGYINTEANLCIFSCLVA